MSQVNQGYDEELNNITKPVDVQIQQIKIVGNTVPDTQPIPQKIISRNQKTIQTHNGVTILGTGVNYNDSGFIDCSGYDNLALTALNDSNTSTTIYVIWSNDGANTHGYETVSPTSTPKNMQAQTPIKARYARVRIVNGDTNSSHIYNAWAYLKS